MPNIIKTLEALTVGVVGVFACYFLLSILGAFHAVGVL